MNFSIMSQDGLLPSYMVTIPGGTLRQLDDVVPAQPLDGVRSA